MQVAVASLGRFHAFDLATQLQQGGMLKRLYTAYPKSKIGKPLAQSANTFPWVFGAMTLANRVGLPLGPNFRDRASILTFDRWMSSRVEQCDVFHCLSSFGTNTHKVAKQRFGALTVCDRGSSHILYQRDILAEEYSKFGYSGELPDATVIERELEEYATCDRIAVASHFVMDSFIARGVPREKLLFCPYGADLSLFSPRPKKDKVFRIIFAGALSLRKGVQYLLEAVKRIQSAGVELWMAGTMTEEIKPILAKYEGIFKHLGVIPRVELAEVFSQGSVKVLASIEDGFGLVLGQAMACGVPVVATTNTGGSTLFDDGVEGFVVPIRDPEAIAEKLLLLRQNPEMAAQMGTAARQRMESFGGWKDYGDQMVNQYRKALAASKN